MNNVTNNDNNAANTKESDRYHYHDRYLTLIERDVINDALHTQSKLERPSHHPAKPLGSVSCVRSRPIDFVAKRG